MRLSSAKWCFWSLPSFLRLISLWCDVNLHMDFLASLNFMDLYSIIDFLEFLGFSEFHYLIKLFSHFIGLSILLMAWYLLHPMFRPTDSSVNLVACYIFVCSRDIVPLNVYILWSQDASPLKHAQSSSLSWPNLLVSFDYSRKPLHVSRDGKPILIAFFDTLDQFVLRSSKPVFMASPTTCNHSGFKFVNSLKQDFISKYLRRHVSNLYPDKTHETFS